jgi:cell wall-associated NlpC family hydrolase
MNQVPFFRQKGTDVSVDKALHTRGALLFRPGHVAISLGDGRTIEARGSAYGVNIFSAQGRGWTSGALIPGLKY